ncbi:MAG TPA: hypothetical protein VK175_20445 [Leadbetterella sp.]|nr:hypothetical protein [Leadbetterella sp.]
MAKASIEVIEALKKTADNLENSTAYMWGHMGSCNCGNLAQVVTKRTKAEIHAYAMQGHGDWNEQVNHYCGQTEMPIDLIIFELLTFGFTTHDLKHLEKLSDPKILERLGDKKYTLSHNQRADVVVYMKEWARMLENQMIENINLPTFDIEYNQVYV